MLDGLPDNWLSNPILAVWVLFCNVLVFLMMLNFIIAIIVDSYAKVCEELSSQKADQEFFTDAADIFTVSCNPAFFGRPSHFKLIESLQKSRKNTLTYMDLRNMSPGWKVKSIKAFMNHYQRNSKNNGSYIIKEPDFNEYLHGDLAEMTGTIDELERRMSVLLNQPCPTMAQRIQRFSQLNRIQKKVVKVCVFYVFNSSHVWMSHVTHILSVHQLLTLKLQQPHSTSQTAILWALYV